MSKYVVCVFDDEKSVYQGARALQEIEMMPTLPCTRERSSPRKRTVPSALWIGKRKDRLACWRVCCWAV